ncbi:tryptophan halogenase family protein [Dyella sp. A6]|uniref:tryptophan halogenase family protein n=1 Tax=Dyella aluminiiresistens TaxID=3069105 RepID=UPI002E7851B5|nr:tryptophan halogenase family protein [Dyella sp. A6]
MARLRKILVVGGGTAGWLTACYLAKVVNAKAPGSTDVALVESPRIGLLGVGEATFPSIRGTLSAIGLDECSFLARTGATFKQGILYRDWVRSPGEPGRSEFFHPFSLPNQRSGGQELLPYWLLGMAPGDMAFAEAVTLQSRLVDGNRGPKRSADADFQGAMNYAYHIDAARVAEVLADHGQTELGVKRHLATVEHVSLDEQGNIEHIATREAGRLDADLYIDCTGLHGKLIGEAMHSPFQSRRDVLFADRAVAMQVPYPQVDAPIPSYTMASAQTAGWIWDIGLQDRRGVGYVYSSAHSTKDEAETLFRQHLGDAAAGIEAQHIRFETGYRPEHWRKNCVAVGLAGGFVEPLESTGIALVELGAYLIAHLLPGDTDDMERAARHYNQMVVARYDRIIDFIKMHYCLSQRRDSAFWVDNTMASTVPETLQDKLALWKHRPPHRLDFVSDLEMFQVASWQYVLYGMEFRTELEPMRTAYPHAEEAQREFRMIQQVAEHALRDLPGHRALVEQMVQRSRTRGGRFL